MRTEHTPKTCKGNRRKNQYHSNNRLAVIGKNIESCTPQMTCCHSDSNWYSIKHCYKLTNREFVRIETAIRDDIDWSFYLKRSYDSLLALTPSAMYYKKMSFSTNEPRHKIMILLTGNCFILKLWLYWRKKKDEIINYIISELSKFEQME